MEKDDKKIKALLNEQFIEKTPDGFTEKVMHRIELVELQQQEKSYRFDWPYLLIMAGSIISALGIIAFIDSAFITRNFHILLVYSTDFFYQMTTLFEGSQLTNTSVLSGNGLIFGALLIMMALLFFDGFVWKRKRYLNLFV